ncbi:chromosome segregation protein SMC, partial [Pseudomonas fragi]|nr:chromosome segregation protein SMC [Pseudomonas sp. GC01]
HLGHDRTMLATLGEELEMLAPEQELTSAAAEEAAAALEESEHTMHGWQEQWDDFNQRSAEPQRQSEVLQARIQQLETSMERVAERQRRLAEERALLAADPEDAAILELSEQLATSELTQEELQASEELLVERLEQVRHDLQQATHNQQQAQGELQRLNGRLASLEALQQAALDPGTGAAQWLQDQQLADRPRLAEGLRVEAGWELAVETVLGADLQAVLVDDFAQLDLAGFAQGDLRLFSAGTQGGRLAGSLLDKVEADFDLSPWLGQVRAVETLEQALAMRVQLADGQSLISRDGYWVGRNFLRVRRASEAQSGVLARGQEIQHLGAEREEREAALASLEEQLQRLREQQLTQEDSREQVRRRLQDEARQQGEIKALLSASKAKVEQLTLRRRRLDEELVELAEQRALEHEQIGESRLQLQDALDAMATDTERRELLLAQRDSLRERL